MNTENEPRNDEQPAVQEENKVEENSSSRPIWVIILASLGVLAVVAALGIGIFQLAGQTPRSLSDIGSNLGGLFQQQERLSISSESMTIASGETVNLIVNHRGRKANEPGVYTVEFSCPEGVSVNVNNDEVSCNTETNLTLPDDGSIQISLDSTGDRYTDVPIVVRFVGEEKEIESNLVLTVVNRSIASDIPTSGSEDEVEDRDTTPAPQTTEKEKEPKTPTKETVVTKPAPTKVTSGVADLRVVAKDTGFIDPLTRKFVSSNKISRSDKAAARFVIKNIGTKESGNWYFIATVPTKYDTYRKSGKQISLRPGQEMEFVLSLDDIDYRSDLIVRLLVDSNNTVREISKHNNLAEVRLDIRR